MYASLHVSNSNLPMLSCRQFHRSAFAFLAGEKCDTCQLGYYGRPQNGGECNPCSCNGHSDICHQTTGQCYCDAKGVTGNNCDRWGQRSRVMCEAEIVIKVRVKIWLMQKLLFTSRKYFIGLFGLQCSHHISGSTCVEPKYRFN